MTSSQASNVCAMTLSIAWPTKAAWLYVGMIAVTVGPRLIWVIVREA